ncbi:MAG: AI-2E family transporter [Bacillales bacterium]
MDFHKKWFLRLGLLLLVFVVMYLFLKLRALWFPVMKIFAVVLTPFVIAAFITYLLHPIVEKLYENNLPRWLSILIIYLLFFGGIGFALYKGIPAFVVQLRDLVENVPQLTNQYREWISAVQVQTSTLPAGSSKSRVTSHRMACEQVITRRAW